MDNKFSVDCDPGFVLIAACQLVVNKKKLAIIVIQAAIMLNNGVFVFR